MCGARYRRVVVKHRPNGGPVGPVEQAGSVLTDHIGGMCGEDPLGSRIERFDPAASIDRNDGLRHVLQHGADARFALVLDHICLAQFDGVQLVHGPVPEIRKRLQVGRRHLPRSTIEDAQRADSVAIRSGKRLPGVEADSGRIGDERIIDEARVEPRVGNDQWVGPLKRVGTKGHATRRLGRRQSLARLKPLSVDIDEAHERNRHVEKPLGDPRDAIEALLGGRIQDVECPQRGESFGLVGGQWRSHSSLLIRTDVDATIIPVLAPSMHMERQGLCIERVGSDVTPLNDRVRSLRPVARP